MGLCSKREARALKKKGYGVCGHKGSILDLFKISDFALKLLDELHGMYYESEYKHTMTYEQFLDKTLPVAPKLQK